MKKAECVFREKQPWRSATNKCPVSPQPVVKAVNAVVTRASRPSVGSTEASSGETVNLEVTVVVNDVATAVAVADRSAAHVATVLIEVAATEAVTVAVKLPTPPNLSFRASD